MASAMTPPHHRRLHDQTGNRIVPGQKLGEGGEGAVYLVEGDAGSAMKIWHPGRTPQDADTKLRHLLRNPVEPELGATWQITWPQRLVQENGVTVGYTMPLLDSGASWEPIVEYYNRRAAQTTEQEQGRELRVDDRVRMATNLALGFRAVHAAGYVIGDVNEKNVEVNRQNDIAMVDCDSYGFTDAETGRTFANHMGRAEFQAPEAQDDYTNRTQNHDRFGLAVIIFHLLTGFHPYTVVNQPDHPQPGDRIRAWLFPPSNRTMVEAPAQYDEAWGALTDGQKALFERCFDWRYQGQARPSPEEWLEALQEIPAEAAPTPTMPSQQPTPQPARPVYPTPTVTPRPQPTHRQRSPAPAQAPPPAVRSADDVDWLYWALAVGGYGVLIPLAVFSQFRPWWWLALMLAAAGLFYLPVRRLLQRPITTTRWIIIGVASLFSIWFLLGLMARAMEIWPWWFWLGAGALAAFVLLVPGRRRLFEMLRSRSARRRWMAIGAVSLLAGFILGNMIAAGVRAWLD